MRGVARCGDAGSHGGTITTCSDFFLLEGRGVARVGDTINEPCGEGFPHCPGPIVTGSDLLLVEGRPVATCGSQKNCGAIVITCSELFLVG